MPKDENGNETVQTDDVSKQKLNQPLGDDYIPGDAMGNMIKDLTGVTYEKKNGEEEEKEKNEAEEIVVEPFELFTKTIETVELPEESKAIVNKFVDVHKEIVAKKVELETKLIPLEVEVTRLKEAEKLGFKNDEKVKGFIEELGKDFLGTIKKYQKDLNLPNPELVIAQLNANQGDIKSRLKNYQEQVLKPKIEKDFKLESGTFVYDADEAENSDSSSYAFRKASRAYEKELEGELEKVQNQEKENQKLIEAQLKADKEFLMKEYFGADEKKVDEAIKELNAAPILIKNGSLPRERHPFGLRNLLLGFHHEALVKAAVDDAVSKTVEQFKAQGMVLKAEKPSTIDSSKAQAGDKDRKKFNEFSPAESAINAYL